MGFAATLTLLLPARARLQGELARVPRLATMLGRGDRVDREAGEKAQLLRHFEVLPRGLPVAALTRELDCGDAGHGQWLRADPSHVRVDLGAGRMLACGELGLSRPQAEALAQSLKPLFGDEGFPISVGHESRWYLMLPREVRLPAFAPPCDVLGDDIFAHLPQGEAGRRWCRLLSEAQIVLHNHPLNTQRAVAGLPAVNSLWFWGEGALPDTVRAPAATSVISDESVLCALADRAGLRRNATATMNGDLLEAGAIIDLRALRCIDEFDARWSQPIALAQGAGKFDTVLLDFGDGAQWRWRASHRWRFWRAAAKTLA